MDALDDSDRRKTVLCDSYELRVLQKKNSNDFLFVEMVTIVRKEILETLKDRKSL